MAIHKVIIIGGACAGYTAAIYTARARLAPFCIEGLNYGGQVAAPIFSRSRIRCANATASRQRSLKVLRDTQHSTRGRIPSRSSTLARSLD